VCLVKKTRKELRKFGFVMAAGFAVVGGLLFWREKAAAPYLLGASGVFLLAAVVVPQMLAPIEWAWMKVASLLGAIVTRVLLTLTYYVAITPLALVARMLGKDSLMLKRSPSTESYWIPVEPGGPCDRPEKPY
jgi:hypothetical protein